jgi:hypothetical protein
MRPYPPPETADDLAFRPLVWVSGFAVWAMSLA